MKRMSRQDLFVHLIKRGYRYSMPVAQTWDSALLYKYEKSVLCVLLRKNGVDLRYYKDYTGGISIDSKNHVSLRDGKLIRNHYNESSVFVNVKIASVASYFARGLIKDEINVEDGRSYRLNPRYQSIREKSQTIFEDQYKKLVADKLERGIWDYINNDNGGYLGGGEWA
ncbi:MAG: hypothetical protein EON54_02015 [Alcaligenaceae bacterium]|nr:MAG: hypothetical protein EON54_02015 [Alcaligenaceae bacterium]